MHQNIDIERVVQTFPQIVKVGYAIKKAIRPEIRHMGESIAEESLNNFISWYTPNVIDKAFGK